MTAAPIKFCKDCANCVPDRGRSLVSARCAKTIKNSMDYYVTGVATPDMDFCTVTRLESGPCGIHAKLFVAKPAVHV